jgi:hypothetical protein
MSNGDDRRERQPDVFHMFPAFVDQGGGGDRRAGMPAIPLPFPTPPITPQPFPTGPAANDPIFRPKIPLGSSIFRAGVAGVIIATSIEILKELGQQQLDKEMREREAELEAAKRARRRDEPFRREIVLPGPDVILDPNRVEFPRPRREIRPAPPLVPRPVFEPVPVSIPTPTVPVPAIEPVPIEIPAPAPTPRATPRRAPRAKPRALPRTKPFFAGLPRFFPIGLPATSPVNVPRLRPQERPLTPTEPLVPSLVQPNIGAIQLPTPQPVPQQDPARRCKEVKRRRKRKGKCEEGFYREFRGKTRFIPWRERDCDIRLVP